MAVKHVQSAMRALRTFEAVAEHQPVGVGALARILADDKSAIHRSLVTLEAAGWIRRTGDGTRWMIATRVVALALAHGAELRTSLRDVARPILEQLRDETGETAILNVLEGDEVVALDVVESTQLVRAGPPVGFIVPTASSAAGLAILAHLDDSRRVELLGGTPEPAFVEQLDEIRSRGWSINDRDATPGACAVGAAVLDGEDRPLGAVTVSGPADRLPRPVLDELGPLVASAAAAVAGK